MPRQLKDSVSRALSGRLLSRPLLSLFIDAFAIADSEAERLWRLWNGSDSIAVLSGRRAVSPQARARPARRARPAPAPDAVAA